MKQKLKELDEKRDKMFVMPFIRNHKSYSVEPEEDTSAADEEFRKWIRSFKENKRIADEIHRQTLKELGETE